MKYCVFGGQYGSEGKGSVSEWLCRNHHSDSPKSKIYAFGDNSPNSGHSCTLGKVRNLPAASFFADLIILGPDSIIDIDVLKQDMATLKAVTGRFPDIFVHEHAAVVDPIDKQVEQTGNLESRLASTVSGSGHARFTKYYYRIDRAVAKNHAELRALATVVDRVGYLDAIGELNPNNMQDLWIYECGHGVLLDTNWGIYPYVTTRTTLPDAALARNGLLLHGMRWIMAGVYRTFPIRTGGNSGPTGSREWTWEELGLDKEIATVTKRIRRVFEFSLDDFKLSTKLTSPEMLFFTHCDYLRSQDLTFAEWIMEKGIRDHLNDLLANSSLLSTYISSECGKFDRFCL